MKDDRWLVAFPLSEAMLCVNCELVSNSKSSCIVCQSEQLIPVARILNPAPKKEETHGNH